MALIQSLSSRLPSVQKSSYFSTSRSTQVRLTLLKVYCEPTLSRTAGVENVEDFTSKLRGDTLVSMQVDPEPPSYQVPKSVLCDTSDYFIKALIGSFEEASTQTLRIPGSANNTIKHLAYWLYHKSLSAVEKELEGCRNDAILTQRFLDLTRLWMLGQQIIVPQLQNAAMATIYAMLREHHLPFDGLTQGYLISSIKSKLSRLFVIEAMAEWGHKCLKHDQIKSMFEIEGFLDDFLSDLRSEAGCAFIDVHDKTEKEFMVTEQRL